MSSNGTFFTRPVSSTPVWYCLRSQPKHEHIAAARLRQLDGVEVFCPRLRTRQMTCRGAVWFVNALFPGYLFARFSLLERVRQVKHVPGIKGVLQFGQLYAALEETTIDQLRGYVDDAEIIVANSTMEAGDAVQITDGAFHGLEAVVLSLLPAKARVKVLLEFLGRKIEAEVRQSEVLPHATHPLAAHKP